MTSADNLELSIDRAAVLCDLSRHDQAIQLLRHTLASFPDDSRAWCQLAVAQLGLGTYEESLQSALRAAALAPESGWPFRVASAALDRLGRAPEAVATARRAATLEPYVWTSHAQLGAALLSDHNPTEAGHCAAQALALAPGEPLPHLLLSRVARALHRFDEAEVHARRALAIDPDDAAALSALAFAETGTSRPLDGARLARSASRLGEAVRAEPGKTFARDSLELMLTRFLRIESYLIWLICFYVLRPLAHGNSPVSRIVPVLLLLAPAINARRMIAGLTPAVRRRFATVVRQPRLTVAILLETVAVAALICACVAPAQVRATVVVIAGPASVAAFVLVLVHTHRVAHRLGIERRYVLSRGTVAFIALALWAVAAMIVLSTGSDIRGLLAAVAFAAAGTFIAWRAYRRFRSPRRGDLR